MMRARSPLASARQLSRRAFVLGSAGVTLLGAHRGAESAVDRLAVFTSGEAGTATLPHDEFDTLLARYVHVSPDGVNRVHYRRWKAADPDRRTLDAYVSGLARANPSSLDRAEQFAFWSNLYNALTIQVVLDAYPVRSIRQIRPNLLALGPWKKPFVEVRKTMLSLDDIEHGILRQAWQEPRVHYAVNCASFGCPNLRQRAWRGATLERDLLDAARDYVNHPRGARFEGDELVVSSIYEWYKVDFGGSDSGVIRHLQAHARPDLRLKLAGVARIARHEYDWSLTEYT
jgi:hypothetical protein